MTPDITVPVEQAFNTAYRLALEGVIENIGEPPSGHLKTLHQEARAALENLENR